MSAADRVARTAILRTLGRVEREFARITRTGPVRTTAQREAAWADLDEPWAGWLARIHAVHAEIAEHHFKHYNAERPLMGKHVGTYWWGWQVRGEAEHGMVVADYEVKGGEAS